MLKIRLQRVGRKHDPSYRIVVTESTRGPKNGKYVDLIGTYNPKSGEISLKEDRVKHWLSVGAQASDTVHNMLVDRKVVEGKKINALPRKRPIVKGGDKKEEKKADETKVEKATSEVAEDVTEDAPAPKVVEETKEEKVDDDSVEETKEEKVEENVSEKKVEEEGKDKKADAVEEVKIEKEDTKDKKE